MGTALNRRSHQFEDAHDHLTHIKVIGVGGGGGNAVNRMIDADVHGIDFVAVNTDAQALVRSAAPTRLRIGDGVARGLGVGGDPKLGMLAADESREEIAAALEGTDMVFIAAGMGGGTGTGAAPVIAEVAKSKEILCIAIVTKPFDFEGVQRARVAEEGIARLKDRADSIIVIPNERLLNMCDDNVSIEGAFRMVDDVLLQSVHGISEVITHSGNINLDFKDVWATMHDAGHAWISKGCGSGPTRAVDAARDATMSPLFDFSIANAKRILFNVFHKENELGIAEVNEAANVIRELAAPSAQIIFGLAADPKMGGDVHITLIATGFVEKRGWEEDGIDLVPGDYDPPETPEQAKRKPLFGWTRQ